MIIFSFSFPDIDEDYVPIPGTLIVLNDLQPYKCFNVTIVNDDYIEKPKYFSVSIIRYELLTSSIHFDPLKKIELNLSSTEITIEDDDGMQECLLLSVYFYLCVCALQKQMWIFYW